MSWITVTEKQTLLQTETALYYSVRLEIQAAGGISKALFVARADDNAFSHVATRKDLLNYPEGFAAAFSTGAFFYRTHEIALQCSSEELAVQASADIRRRLDSIVREVGASAQNGGFGGSRQYLYDSETSE